MIRRLPLLVTAALLLGAAPAAAFELDPSFNGGGTLSSRGAVGIVAAPDGGVFTADFTPDSLVDPLAGGKLDVERHRPDGSLDPSWDGDGVVRLAVDMPAVEPFGRYGITTPSILPNALGGVDVLFVSGTPKRSRLVRLTSSGTPDPAFNGGAPLDVGATVVVIPDGDGVAVAAAQEDNTTALRRIGPDGTTRAGWPQTLTEVGARTPCLLVRRPDGSLVVAALDPMLLASPLGRTTDDYRLAARSASGGPVPGYAPPSQPAVVPFGGLAATDSGRVLVGGANNVANRSQLQWLVPATGAPDTAFGAGGVLSLKDSVFLGSSVRQMTSFGPGVVVSGVDNGVDPTQWLAVFMEDGTVLAGPQTIPVTAGRPIYYGLPPVVTADRSRIYVVVADPGNPTAAPGPGDPPAVFKSNVVALKGSSLPPVPVPPAPAPPVTTPTPVTPPPAPAVPRPTVTVTRAVAAKGGIVKLTIRTSAGGDLLTSASVKSGRRTLRWGPVAATVSRATTRTVTLRPSTAVRRALARRGAKLRATVTVRFLPARGLTVQVRRTVSLRR